MIIAIADKHGHSLQGHQLIEWWYVLQMDKSEGIVLDWGSHMLAVQERLGMVTSIQKAWLLTSNDVTGWEKGILCLGYTRHSTQLVGMHHCVSLKQQRPVIRYFTFLNFNTVKIPCGLERNKWRILGDSRTSIQESGFFPLLSERPAAIQPSKGLWYSSGREGGLLPPQPPQIPLPLLSGLSQQVAG